MTLSIILYKEVEMDHEFKDPYSAKYFFGLLLVLALPTLPAILTSLGILLN